MDTEIAYIHLRSRKGPVPEAASGRPAPGTMSGPLNLRRADLSDLDAVNALIEKAIATWRIAERVKRLSLPLFHYQPHDLHFLQIMVCEAEGSGIIGVAAWEQAAPADTPAGTGALLLHGIYVAPDQHRKGIGTRLLEAAEQAASARGMDGVIIIKAQPEAEDFFRARGLQPLPVQDPRRDYPHRFWKPVKRD